MNAFLPPRLRNVSTGWWLMAVSFPLQIYIIGATVLTTGLLVGPLQDEFGWSVTSIALVLSFQRLEGGIVSPVVGFMIDRMGGRGLLLGGAVVMGAGMVLVSQIQELWQFYAAFLVISIGSSLGSISTINAMLIK